MSAKFNRVMAASVRPVSAAVLLLLAPKGYSASIWDGFNDPLLANPPILESGAVLPDGSRINCPAQVDLSQALGVAEVIDMALCSNPRVKQAWANIKVQASTLGEAKSAYLPKVQATVSSQQLQVDYPQDSSSNFKTKRDTNNTNLTWRLFDFGGREASKASADLVLYAALQSYDADIQQTLQRVIQSYFDVLTNEASVKARKDALVYAKSSLEATLRKEARGASAKNESLQAQAALARAQLLSSRTEGEYRKSYAKLIFEMGLPTNTQVTLEEPPEPAQSQTLNSLASWLDKAQQDHPSIKAARAQWEAGKQKIIAARAAGLPTLDFVASYNQNGYPDQAAQPIKSNTGTIGLTLNIPIFEGFATSYKIRGAQAQAERALAELEENERQVLTEIVKAHSDAVSALLNLESSKVLLTTANAALVSSVNRYTLGAGDVMELLNAQNTLAEAQEERIRCIAEWRSASLRLMANAGVIGRIGK